MKKRIAAVLLAVLMGTGLLSGCGTKQAAENPGASAEEKGSAAIPEETAEPAEKSGDAGKLTLLIQVRETDPAPGYILLQNENSLGFLALPTEGEQIQEIIQKHADGTEWRNVIRMTPEGFCMIEADCEGQDCIGEGEVTLENMQERVLWNMVICAPHQLILSLYTPAEAAEQSQKWLGY